MKSTSLQIDVAEDIVLPKEYVVYKTEEPLTIDGLGDERAWESAPLSELFIDIEGVKNPHFDTQMKMLWDDTYLYIFGILNEPHIWGDITKRDAVIFFNNDFEVFLKPEPLSKHYAEIEINALNTLWDLTLNKPYRIHGLAKTQWDIAGIKHAVAIDGTLNDPKDEDKKWTVEIAIPLKSIIELKSKPRKIPVDGEHWRINFSRVQWDHEIINGTYQRAKDEDGNFKPEYNWVWSNQKVINMHEPEKWGSIMFSTNTPNNPVHFNKEGDRLIEQVLYTLYRRTRFGDLQYLTELHYGDTRKMIVYDNAEELVTATFYKTNRGFEWIVPYTTSSKKILINENEDLKIIP